MFFSFSGISVHEIFKHIGYSMAAALFLFFTNLLAEMQYLFTSNVICGYKKNHGFYIFHLFV